MFQTKIARKIETQFFSESRALYEITWKKYSTARHATDNIARRMRFACHITKARIRNHTNNI